MSVTPYMGLSLPTPGPNSAVPDWGNLLNTAFSLLDGHDHTAGHGIQVPSAGININADLTYNGWNLTQARTLRLQQQAAAPALAADAGAIYVTTAGDLWYNNGAGQHVQITSGAALSAASLGGISGLGGTSAGVAFNNATKTFTFTQAANQGAILDSGPLVIHDAAASAFGITLQSPVGIAGAYTLTFPAALPAANSLLSIGSSGALTAFGTVSGNNLTLSGTLSFGTLANPIIQVATANGVLSILGNRVAADTNSDVVVGATATRTAGRLLDIQNGGINQAGFDYQGLLSLTSQAGPIQPSSIVNAMSMAASWNGNGFRYWKDATGAVRVYGQAFSNGGGAGAVVATLPAGFRPAATRYFACVNVTTSALVLAWVTSSGNITLSAAVGGTVTFAFDSISFLAEL